VGASDLRPGHAILGDDAAPETWASRLSAPLNWRPSSFGRGHGESLDIHPEANCPGPGTKACTTHSRNLWRLPRGRLLRAHRIRDHRCP